MLVLWQAHTHLFLKRQNHYAELADRSVTRTAVVCAGSLYHSPAYCEVDNHHVYPKYLCSLLGVPERRETVPLCSTDHDNAHHALVHLINNGESGGHRLSAGLQVHVDAAWRWWQATVTLG